MWSTELSSSCLLVKLSSSSSRLSSYKFSIPVNNENGSLIYTKHLSFLFFCNKLDYFKMLSAGDAACEDDRRDCFLLFVFFAICNVLDYSDCCCGDDESY